MAASNGPGETAEQPSGERAAPVPQGLVRVLHPVPGQPAGVPALDTTWQRGLYQSLSNTETVCTEPLTRPTFSFSTQGLFTH